MPSFSRKKVFNWVELLAYWWSFMPACRKVLWIRCRTFSLGQLYLHYRIRYPHMCFVEVALEMWYLSSWDGGILFRLEGKGKLLVREALVEICTWRLCLEQVVSENLLARVNACSLCFLRRGLSSGMPFRYNFRWWCDHPDTEQQQTGEILKLHWPSKHKVIQTWIILRFCWPILDEPNYCRCTAFGNSGMTRQVVILLEGYVSPTSIMPFSDGLGTFRAIPSRVLV